MLLSIWNVLGLELNKMIHCRGIFYAPLNTFPSHCLKNKLPVLLISHIFVSLVLKVVIIHVNYNNIQFSNLYFCLHHHLKAWNLNTLKCLQNRPSTIWPYLSISNRFVNKPDLIIPQSLQNSMIKNTQIVLQHNQNKYVILPDGARQELVSPRAGGYVLEGRKSRWFCLVPKGYFMFL